MVLLFSMMIIFKEFVLIQFYLYHLCVCFMYTTANIYVVYGTCKINTFNIILGTTSVVSVEPQCQKPWHPMRPNLSCDPLLVH